MKLKDMHELVGVYDEMQNCLPSLLELFRLIVHRGLDNHGSKCNQHWSITIYKKNMTNAENWLDNQ
ncbi:hypothetical protein DYY65_11495 [Nitrososphaera sp. AFS]|nr:hypothetical protein [Nitrososphaera sp. AFS]